MTALQPSIHDYTIDDVSVGTGCGYSANNFHVYETDEVISKEKMQRRAIRSDHFSISLALKGGSSGMKINFTDYTLIKNSLFIVPQETVHQFLGEHDGFNAIIIRFSRQFLTDAGLHIKFNEVFNFLAFQQKPHFVLTDAEAGILHTIMLLLYQRERFEEERPYRTESIYLVFNLFMFELFAILKNTGQKIITKQHAKKIF